MVTPKDATLQTAQSQCFGCKKSSRTTCRCRDKDSQGNKQTYKETDGFDNVLLSSTRETFTIEQYDMSSPVQFEKCWDPQDFLR